MKDNSHAVKGIGTLVTPTNIPRGAEMRCISPHCITKVYGGGYCAVCGIVKRVGYTMSDCRGV